MERKFKEWSLYCQIRLLYAPRRKHKWQSIVFKVLESSGSSGKHSSCLVGQHLRINPYIEHIKVKRMDGPSKCNLCREQEKSAVHIFLHCYFTKEIWAISRILTKSQSTWTGDKHQQGTTVLDQDCRGGGQRPGFGNYLVSLAHSQWKYISKPKTLLIPYILQIEGQQIKTDCCKEGKIPKVFETSCLWSNSPLLHNETQGPVGLEAVYKCRFGNNWPSL